MVSRMMVPKISTTSALELVTLCGKRDSEDVTQLRILRRGDHPGLFRQVVFYDMSQKRQSQRDVLKRVMEER